MPLLAKTAICFEVIRDFFLLMKDRTALKTEAVHSLINVQCKK